MSERDQTLMRTRCPECGTVFRVTSEQLRRKAGKVRCGQCQAVFNAFDHWQSEAADETLVAEPMADLAVAPLVIDADEQPAPAPEPEAEAELVAEPQPAAGDYPIEAPIDAPADAPVDDESSTEPVLSVEPISEPARSDARLDETLVAHVVAAPDTNGSAALESSEEATQAARAAGLVAAPLFYAYLKKELEAEVIAAQKEAENTRGNAAVETREGLRLRAARWLLDDHAPQQALEQLNTLPQGTARRIQALRLRLQAARQLGRMELALETGRALVRHKAFSPEAGQVLMTRLGDTFGGES